MKKLMVLLLLILPVFAMAQIESEVEFETGLNWQQIKQKAEKEHKLIFMDCYTTWCGPCKQMDEQVYKDLNVAAYINSHYISVKVQIDSTSNDNYQVKSWYKESKRINYECQLRAFPTFLFFSPDGYLLHRSIGFHEPTDFISIARDGVNPDKQEYALLRKFEMGALDYPKIKELIMLLESDEEREEVKPVIAKYVINYLVNQSAEQIINKTDLPIMFDYLTDAGFKKGAEIIQDKVYLFFIKHEKQIDDSTRIGYTRGAISNVIKSSTLQPMLWYDHQLTKPKTANPDWSKISELIAKRFGKQYIYASVLFAQRMIYEQTKQWDKLIQVTADDIDRTGLKAVESMTVNNFCYNTVFKYSHDRKMLLKAASWMHEFNKVDPNNVSHMDTEASLLYKAGETKKAIMLENQAAHLVEKNAEKNHVKPDQAFAETLASMRAAKPIWADAQ